MPHSAKLEKQQRLDVQLSKGMASLSIMEVQLRAPKTPRTSQHYHIEGLKEVP